MLSVVFMLLTCYGMDSIVHILDQIIQFYPLGLYALIWSLIFNAVIVLTIMVVTIGCFHLDCVDITRVICHASPILGTFVYHSLRFVDYDINIMSSVCFIVFLISLMMGKMSLNLDKYDYINCPKSIA